MERDRRGGREEREGERCCKKRERTQVGKERMGGLRKRDVESACSVKEKKKERESYNVGGMCG